MVDAAVVVVGGVGSCVTDRTWGCPGGGGCFGDVGGAVGVALLLLLLLLLSLLWLMLLCMVVLVVVVGSVGCWCCCRRHWQRLQLHGCGAAFDLQTHVMRHVHLSWHVATISCTKRSLAFGGNRRRKRHDVTARAPQFVRSCYKYDIAASNRYVRVGDLFR